MHRIVRWGGSLGRAFALLACILAGAPGAAAAEVTVAVAANFAEVVETLTPVFAHRTSHRIRQVAGSTGKLYAQIRNGAPFDVLLAADQLRPRLLAEEGLGAPESRFTYATGRLALWSADPTRIGADGAETLRRGDFRFLAIANPELAPYGAAAKQALKALGLWQALEARIVRGENIGQTFGMVASGGAELGLVALSSVLSPRNPARGSRWEVPAELHDPIRQDAILLAHGAGNPAAAAFLAFLRGEAARHVIVRFGYATEAR